MASSSRVRIKIQVSLFVHLAKMNEQHYATLPPSSHAVLSNSQLTLSPENLVNLSLLFSSI